MFVRRYWYSDSISDIAERFQISNNYSLKNKINRYSFRKIWPEFDQKAVRADVETAKTR